MRPWRCLSFASLAFVLLTTIACGDTDAETSADERRTASRGEERGEARASRGGGQRGGQRGGTGGWGGGGFDEPEAAVPVEVAPAVRRQISAYLETNGTLEAENDVDLVARTAGPVLELRVEEGQEVAAGELLAQLDPLETRARLEIARVDLDEARIAWRRAQNLFAEELISEEQFEQTRSAFESAEAQLRGEELIYSFTEIRAPFAGVVSARYVKFAQNVAVSQPLFRLTSFDPLLCPIQVPERELPRIEIGQEAHVTVEAWPGERFQARVLRISPVVDAATGTVKVTLELRAGDRLRPGMFTSVFLETESRPNALVIPRSALSLESIGDTVYVAAGDVATRREVALGFQEGDLVEVVSGLEEGESVIVVGQDGLSEGTPIKVLATRGVATVAVASTPAAREPGQKRSPTGGPRPGRGGQPAFDPAQLTPERLEMIRERMRQRGLSDDQIEERLQQMRERAGAGRS